MLSTEFENFAFILAVMSNFFLDNVLLKVNDKHKSKVVDVV